MFKQKEIIMGLDPASTKNLGVSIIEYNKKKKDMKILEKCTFIFDGTKETKNKRLSDIKNMILEKISKYKIDKIASEKVPWGGVPFVLSQMNELMGVVKMVAWESEINFFEYAPKSMKLDIAGNGKASKKEVQDALSIMFNLSDKFSSDHESDAVAAAVTCIKREMNDERAK